MQVQQDIVIKISFEGKIKRVTIVPEYNSLIDLIPEIFEDLKGKKFFLSYIDNEQDTISIDNQSDFNLAIHFSNSLNVILKIFIETKDQILTRELQSIKASSIRASFIKEITSTYDFVSLKCENCKRIFNHQRSFEIHSSACYKVFSTKRSPFNSHMMRMRGIASTNNITLIHLNTLFIMKTQYPIRNDNQRKECLLCNRKFALTDFEIHLKICKIIHARRPPFDSKKQRMLINDTMLKTSEEEIQKKKKKSGMAKWKRESLRLRDIMKIKRMLLRD